MTIADSNKVTQLKVEKKVSAKRNKAGKSKKEGVADMGDNVADDVNDSCSSSQAGAHAIKSGAFFATDGVTPMTRSKGRRRRCEIG
jgi:hypothetical protein